MIENHIYLKRKIFRRSQIPYYSGPENSILGKELYSMGILDSIEKIIQIVYYIIYSISLVKTLKKGKKIVHYRQKKCYKKKMRNHWRIENSLHHVLDELFHEDRSAARNSKNNMAVLRKFAYNILRLAIMAKKQEQDQLK